MPIPFLRFSSFRQIFGQPLVQVLLIGSIALTFSACGSPIPPPTTPSPTSTAIPQVSATTEPTPIATATSTPLPAPTVTVTPDSAPEIITSTGALPQIFADSLGIVIQPDGGEWQGVGVLSIAPQLWAVYTIGFRSFDPIKNHALAIYTDQDGAWAELNRVELECADYVGNDSVQQVTVDQASLWLQVDTGAGAHSGCFDLLRWDGTSLTIEVSGFNSSPGAGDVRDVDGDGQAEVVLNATDPYVFCYACGVRLFDLSILHWDGVELRPVELTRLPGDTVADLRNANNRAVELAEVGLLPAAMPLIEEALSYAPNDQRVYWNHQIIHALAAGRKSYAVSSPFPILSWIFAGDWDMAQALLADYSPTQLFDPQMVMLRETAAANWEETLADWILQFSEPVLTIQPDLASAWFLQGWARFLKDPGDPAVVSAIERAIQLDPDFPLYPRSLEQLSSRGIDGPIATATSPSAVPTPAIIETVRFPNGATVYEMAVDLASGLVPGYRLGIGRGQTLFVTGSGTARFWLVDGAGRPISSTGDGGATRFDIPATDTYTLIIQGSGIADVLLSIPPLSLPETPAPASSERVRFAVGATSAALEATLTPGAPIGYILGIGAGQRLWVTTPAGDAEYWVLDPDGKNLSPLNRTSSRSEYAIPRTGDYTLVVNGTGVAQVVVEIPPR